MHTPTLLILLVILLGILCLAHASAWYFWRRDRAQLFWAGAYFCASISTFNFLVRDHLPGLMVILTAQAGHFLTAYLMLMGVRAYLGRRVWPLTYLLLALSVLLPLMAYFTVYDPNPAVRVAMASVPAAFLYALCAWSIAQGSRRLYPARYLFALFSAIHAVFVLARAPLVFLAEPQALAALQGGMIPPLFLLETIVALVCMAVLTLMLLTERVTGELRQLAEIDPLTNVFNRRSFLVLFDKALRAARRRQQPLSLLLIDLDHFKTVNDRYGHQVGDEALCHFVQVAQSGLRAEDVLGRIGGEEFAAFLPDASLADSQRIAERVRLAVQEQPLRHALGSLDLTVSIGAAEFLPGESLEGAMHRADEAMYRAKQAGRNRVSVWQAAPAGT